MNSKLSLFFSTSLTFKQLQHYPERIMKVRVRLDRNHRSVIQISRVNRSKLWLEEAVEVELNTYQPLASLSLTMMAIHRVSSTNISPKHWILAISPTKVSKTTNKQKLFDLLRCMWREKSFFWITAADFLGSSLLWQLIVTREHHWFDNIRILR